MTFLSIKDAPLLTNISGDEKIPTGGYGDLAVSINQLKQYIHLDLSNVDNTSDLNKPISLATQAALALKANITYVDTSLSFKADKVYVDDQLALKASKIYVDTELQKTASKTYVDNQLSTKASTTYVDSINSTKANIAYVDSELALKSDITYVDTALANKTHNSLVGRDSSSAHPASSIADASGKTQQEVNDEVGLNLNAINDPKTGAYTVGYKGASSGGNFDIQSRKPRKVFSKLFAAASAAAQIRVAVIGDSLAGAKFQHLWAMLDRKIGGTSIGTVNTAGNTQAGGTTTGGTDLNYSATVGMTAESAQYQYWPTGDVNRFDTGGSANLIQSGGNPIFTRIRVFYIKEPNAGTINLTVGGTQVATANAANASVSLGVLEYSQSVAQVATSISVTGGSVRVLFAHVENTSVSGVDLYYGMNKGGLLLANAVTSSQGVAIWQAALTAISPDLVTFEMDDDFGTDAASAAAWTTFSNMLSTAAPLSDKLIIGSTPRSANDTWKLASSNYLRGQVAAKGADYLFFDSYYLMGTYADMDAIFGTDDGTHPVAAAQAYAASIMWNYLGLNANYLGYVPRAVNDRNTPSTLSRGTKFGARAGQELSINTDASFGLDWWINSPRSFSYSGVSNDYSNPLFRISANTGVFSNVLPLSVDFNSSGNVRKMDTSTATGMEYTRLRKTDNAGGGLMHLQTGLVRSGFTRAELLAINANANIGAMAFCTDCTGGAQWVYARGGSTTDWVTVDGKTAI